jgi:hypothetical protein
METGSLAWIALGPCNDVSVRAFRVPFEFELMFQNPRKIPFFLYRITDCSDKKMLLGVSLRRQGISVSSGAGNLERSSACIGF